ncbi:MAG TPA: ATP-binding cassette domain-containing protein [Candidatus Binatia bacterium]|nr:ATP-binding cassette domain-containing protein [Candidatus Binatia bacterium]
MSLLLKDISLPLAHFVLRVNVELQGRTTGIFGPSGAGKTSLLDLIAGLRRAKSAFIQLDNEILTDTDRRISIPPRRRGIGYVPQDLALFPHLSVQQNLLYGQKSNDDPKPLFSLKHVVDVLELQPLVHRGVKDLSGGEQQRVALARALLASPRLLLLDEPLGSLDSQLKARILPYLTRIRDEFQVPMLYVTHDAEEVAALCDNVVRLDRGQVAGHGATASVLKMS